MEAISKKLLEYIAQDCRKLIKILLEKWYIPNLVLDDQLKQILASRRCLDWSLLHLHTKYGVKDVPGLILIPDYITEEEETDLVNNIDKCKWNTDLKRRTQQYGFKYNYQSRNALEFADPIPMWVKHIQPFKVDQVIINEYNKGQGICAHVDNVDQFGDYVASISLLSDSKFEFTRLEDNKKVILNIPKRSIFIMTHDSRYTWTHCLPAKKSSLVSDRRISVTYRHMRINYPDEVRDMNLIPKKLKFSLK